MEVDVFFFFHMYMRYNIMKNNTKYEDSYMLVVNTMPKYIHI